MSCSLDSNLNCMMSTTMLSGLKRWLVTYSHRYSLLHISVAQIYTFCGIHLNCTAKLLFHKAALNGRRFRAASLQASQHTCANHWQRKYSSRLSQRATLLLHLPHNLWHQKGKFLITQPGFSDTNEWLQSCSKNLLSVTESPLFKLLLRCFTERQLGEKNRSRCKKWKTCWI